MDLTKKMPYESESFAAVIDCNTTICIPNPGRNSAIAEAYRVLEPGGYYLFYGVGPTELTTKYPGAELNSGIFPDSGKFEKEYTREELIDSYRSFEAISLYQVPGSDKIEGREISYTMWVAIFRKPQ